MVVDDDPDLRLVIRLVLEQNGYLVETVPDGATALAQMRVRTPDLVLADLRMAPVGGLDLLRLIRQTPELNSTRVVLLTGDSDAKVAATEADSVVIKPFEPDHLIGVIRSLLPK